MSQRITQKFAQLKSEQRAALVSFTMAFDPDKATSLEILKALPEAGADILELGMPFSDPMADGPAIEAAGLRALKNGATLLGILEIVTSFRKTNNTTPVILMGYYNPIHHFGIDAFTAAAKKAGVDGLIVVDLPTEEDSLLRKACQGQGLSLIKLVTPTTSDLRLQKTLANASGFIYYVSVAGITGTKSASTDSVRDAIARIRKHTDLPVAVGFGIKDRAGVAALGAHADAVVVGSALVRAIEASPKQTAADAAGKFIASLLN
jgi:tryptophan synthase alpha chain